MKIASVTTFCNESFRISSWLDYYQEYSKDVDLHVIVNNGNPKDTELLKSIFPTSLVLYSENRALTASYNLAFKEILKDKDVDAIMQITNDIKIKKNGVRELYDFLNSNSAYGMVSPVLLKKDEYIIELYGAKIHPRNLSFIHLEKGKRINDVLDIQVCDGLPGGMNMASREFYENVGLQDENLFMYFDEVDIGIRGKKAGYRFAATNSILAWHQHVNKNNKTSRDAMSGFLCGRNGIYLAIKHYGLTVQLLTSIHRLFHSIKTLIGAFLKHREKDRIIYCWNYLIGVIYGILRIMKNPYID